MAHMTIKSLLASHIEKLEDKNVDTARLDAEILIADSLKVDRSWLHANMDKNIDEIDLDYDVLTFLRKLEFQIDRRTKHEPLAYIRGFKEFYGHKFIVNSGILTPRPETEDMVDLVVKVSKFMDLSEIKNTNLVDIGTGSGCIIISAYLELDETYKFKSYTGFDVDQKALEIAEKNAKNLGAPVDFCKLDISKELKKTNILDNSFILANLPYVPNKYKINESAKHEPKNAIFAGPDGLDYYRNLFKMTNETIPYVLTESLDFQHKQLEEIAKDSGYEPVLQQGLIQVFKRT